MNRFAFLCVIVCLLFSSCLSAPTEVIPETTIKPTSTPVPSETPFPPTLTPTPTNTPIPPTFVLMPTETSISPTSVFHIGSTKVGKDRMILLYVPAGNFIMGSDNSDKADEKPEHQVYLDGFWIDKTEVTNKMYASCVTARVCKTPTQIGTEFRSSYYGNSTYNNFPVIWVDWEMAKTYCEWVNRRLPTEAEWEKAARGTDGRTYPWGEKISCSLANYWDGSDRCGNDTTKVGSYLGGASIYGALDMAGNVWEYVNDWYSETYYFNSPTSNPLGPESGQYRVSRGGSWFDSKDVVRSSFRSYAPPAYADYSATDNQGFRCAMSANQ